MPKKISQQEIDNLIDIIQLYPEGIGLQELQNKVELPRRTLQRRLSQLVKAHLLATKGQQRSLRYVIKLVIAETTPVWPTEKQIISDEIYVPLSPAADEIKQAIRKPLHQRKPVSYNRRFLDTYQPNKTFYLPETLRKHLLALGTPPDGIHPAGTYAREILNRLLIDLSWNSSRLEGNTYSLLETERLIDVGKVAEGKATFETQMILNHKAAIEFLVEYAQEIDFNSYTILNLHALLADNLLKNPAAIGNLRKIAVGIGKTVYQPIKLPTLIEECFQKVLNTATKIKDPFEQAFFAMVHLSYLQAFEDVNKRVSRLAANIPFIKHNLCPLSFIDVPEQAYIDGILGVYEFNKVELLRDVFAWTYERSAFRYTTVKNTLGNPEPFRFHYRQQMLAAITLVIKNSLNRDAATKFLQQWAAENITTKDRVRFVEVVEIELLNLHEGNIARFKLVPAEFKKWHTQW